MDWTKPQYTTAQICSIVGAQQPKVRQWTMLGLYVADKPGRGAGYPSAHSLRNALQMIILQRLADMTMNLQAARPMAKQYVDLVDVLDTDYQRASGMPDWVYASTDGQHATLVMSDTESWPDVIGLNLRPLIDSIAKEATEIT